MRWRRIQKLALKFQKDPTVNVIVRSDQQPEGVHHR
jgi:hypothetical protein